MATGVDPEEGGTVYADAQSRNSFIPGVGNYASSGFVITPTPTPTGNPDRSSSATLTSEHGGRNEPLPPSQAGIELLATNLDRQLAPLDVNHHQATDPATGTIPVVEDLLDIPGTYSIRGTTSAPTFEPAVNAAAGPRNDTGTTVTGGNGIGSMSSVSSA